MDNSPSSSLEGFSLNSVTYYAGASATGTQLSGAPSQAGTYTAIVSFPGSPDYTAAQSDPVTFIIRKANPSVLIDKEEADKIALVMCVASVVGVDNQPGETLENTEVSLNYYAGTSASGSPLPGPPVDPGTYTAYGFFPGSTDYNSAQGQLTYVITADGYSGPVTPDIELGEPNGTYTGSAFNAYATVDGADPGTPLGGSYMTLTYFNSSGTQLSGPPIHSGAYSVDAVYPGGTGYTSASSQLSFSISPTMPQLLITDDGGPYTGSSYPATATLNGVDPGVDDSPPGTLEGQGVTIKYYDGSGHQLSAAPSLPGTCTATASFNGTQDYSAISASTTFTIGPMVIAENYNLVTGFNVPITVDVLSSDISASGTNLTFKTVSEGGSGEVEVNPGLTLTYYPNPDFIGNDQFTYTAMNGEGGFATGTVYVTVEPPPGASDINIATAPGAQLTFDVLPSVTAPSNANITVTGVGPSQNGGTVTYSGHTITYKPAANYKGTDYFTYTVSDQWGGTGTASVYMTVGALANDLSAVTAINHTVTLNVLGSVVAPGSATLSILSMDSPSGGSLSFNPDHTLTYTPTSGWHGIDTFSYTASDGLGDIVTGNVQVTVGVAATDVGVTTSLNTGITVHVLPNVTAASYGTVQISAGTASHGTVHNNGNGTITYTPSTGYAGADTFTFTAVDGLGGSATANVDVSVGPFAGEVDAATPAGTQVTIDVVDSVTDAGSATLTLTSLGATAEGGTVTISGNAVQYTPPASWSGVDSFSYTVSAGAGVSVTGTVYVTVGVTAYSATSSTPKNTAATVSVLDYVLAPPNANLTVSGVTQPAHGAVVLNADGTVKYTPVTNFTGIDTFTYTVSDGLGDSATGTVTVTVSPPTITTTSLTDWDANDAGYNQTITASNGTGSVTFSTLGDLPPGLSLSSSGVLSGTPTTQGTYTFLAIATDSVGATGLTVYTVNINAPLQLPPYGLPDAITGQINYTQYLYVTGGDGTYTLTSPDAGDLDLNGLVLSSSGVLSNMPGGITGAAGDTLTFSVVVTDGTGATATQTYTLTFDAGVALTTASLPNGVAGQYYFQQITATGDPDNGYYFWSTDLPTGLTLSGYDGQLFGTLSAGVYNFSISVMGTSGYTSNYDTINYTLTITAH